MKFRGGVRSQGVRKGRRGSVLSNSTEASDARKTILTVGALRSLAQRVTAVAERLAERDDSAPADEAEHSGGSGKAPVDASGPCGGANSTDGE